MKLTEMRELLARRGIQLTKSLGQNFLHDGNQLRRIVAAAELGPTDQVLEIGPGLGPLTELLLAKAGAVLAIEKDARLVAVLRERFAPLTPSLSPSDGERVAGRPGEGKFELLHADALKFLRREPRDWSDWKLVANLPYSVASPILVELAQAAQRPERMVATLQLEVAKRLMARAGDKDYGVLTLLVQLDYEPREWFKIPASCFYPEPDVDSACVVLVRREKPLVEENQRETFKQIVKRSFSQRRKMMMKLLKQDWQEEKLRSLFTELNISPQERAEKLSLEQFVALTISLSTESRSEEVKNNFMAQSEPLPERLQYLQPFREFLAKLPKSEVGDGTDTTLLEELIYQQIQGKTVREAKEKLKADLEELDNYLSAPRRRNDRLHFVLGYFLIAAEGPEELLKPPEKLKPIEERLIMELPPKAKSNVDEYSLTVKWKRQRFLALRHNMDDEFSRKVTLAAFAHPNASEYERFLLMGEPALAEMVPPAAREIRHQSISVNLGKVTGHKYVSSGEPPATGKRVDYLLQIPGCYVSIYIQSLASFDETEWDSYLATLRCEKPSDIGATPS